MTALQKIAMGLLIVIIHAPFGGWDALPDPLGWVLVLLGLRQLGPGSSDSTLRAAAWFALVASVATYPPMLLDRMSDSTQWLVTLPQTLFEVLLCYAVPDLAGGARRRSFRTVASLIILGAVGLLVRFGADVSSLEAPVALTAVVANLWLIWLLFASSRNVENPQVTSRPADR